MPVCSPVASARSGEQPARRLPPFDLSPGSPPARPSDRAAVQAVGTNIELLCLGRQRISAARRRSPWTPIGPAIRCTLATWE
jgi:hypothetical protein